MRRREFLALLCAMALARTRIAKAREPVRRIGMLMPFAEDDPEALIRVATFSQKLQELGWVVGRNIRLEARWSGVDPSRTRRSAAELAAIAPDVILAAGTPALVALGNEKPSIPIVFVAVPDPVGQGLVANLARPGGNVTGFANLDFPVDGKWLELLKAIAPGVTRVLLRSEEHTSELQSRVDLVCGLLLEKKKIGRLVFVRGKEQRLHDRVGFALAQLDEKAT